MSIYATSGCALAHLFFEASVNVIQIIKDGGYATDTQYVSRICTLVEKYNLAQYDIADATDGAETWYRVRKTWADSKSQKGAFHVLEYAKQCADENAGYSVFDESGKAVYTSAAGFAPYLVRVVISDLKIRRGSY